MGQKSRMGMKLLTIAMLAFLSACSQKPLDEGVEGMEDADFADTAAVEEIPETVETIPTDQAEAVETLDTAAEAPQSAMMNDPTPPPATNGEVATYTVERGDTLMKIAFKVYGDIMQWRRIYNLNSGSLADPNALEVGTTVQYERPASEPVIERNGEPYLIKNGDTLGTIAQQVYGQSQQWRKLWENNRTLIRDPNKIYAGFYLYYQITEAERQQAFQANQNNDDSVGQQPTFDSAPTDVGGGGLDSLAGEEPRDPASN